MRKTAAAFLMAGAVALTGAASLMAQEADAPVIAPVPCAAPGELTMWVWDEAWATVIGQAIDDWTAEYCPGAAVDLQVQPWSQYWDLLRTNIAGGDMPDVFNMSQDRFFFYAENEAILNLQPYLDEAGIDSSVWGAGMIDPYRWGETDDLHAVPVNWDTVALYYNRDLFDAAGLEYPTNDWTWDDFAAAAEALTDPEADVYGAAVYSEFQSGYTNFIASTGTSPVMDAGRTTCTLGEPGSLEALNFLHGLYEAGFMPSVSTIGGASADDSFNYWLAGRVAMVSGGSWKLPTATEQATFNWDVVQLPAYPETGLSSSVLHSVGYVASAQSPEADLAANLVLFLGSDQAQAYFAAAGGVAPANPALQDEWIAAFDPDKNIQAFVNAATQDSQGITAFDEIWSTVNTDLVINIFDLNVPVEEAVAAACDVINQYTVPAAS
jgi:multiple sugar transport system substrate-binding protein